MADTVVLNSMFTVLHMLRCSVSRLSLIFVAKEMKALSHMHNAETGNTWENKLCTRMLTSGRLLMQRP